MLRLALALLLPWTVVACSGGSEPAALGAEQLVSTPPPGEDSLAPGETGGGSAKPEADPVEAAVREYVAAANVAMSTGDTTRFRKAVTPECTCLAFADTIERIYESNSRTPEARWIVVNYRGGPSSGSTATGVVAIDASPYSVLGLDGSVQESVPSDSFEHWIRLTDSVDSWRVADVDRV